MPTTSAGCEQGGAAAPVPWAQATARDRDLLISSWQLIEHTRHEISQLGAEIQAARDTVERSLRLLSRMRRGS